MTFGLGQKLSRAVLTGSLNLVFGWRLQRGQGMVEYALILVLVSIEVIVILLTMGHQIQNVFSNIVRALGCSPGTGPGHC